MRVPIWVAAFELECCQPDATVGEPWTASVVVLKSADPWWAEYAPEPVPEEIRTMGVVDLEGTTASATLHARAGIVDIGPFRVIVPGATGTGPLRVRGRLWLDAHEHPEFQQASGLRWQGVVRRILGIQLVYRPVTVYRAIPIRQKAPVLLGSTSDRRDPAMADRAFSEFLIEVEV